MSLDEAGEAGNSLLHFCILEIEFWKFPAGTAVRGASQVVQVVNNPPGFNAWVRGIPWRRAQQPTPIFLPGESHGQRSLVGYGP